jgi:hypothetical protein
MPRLDIELGNHPVNANPLFVPISVKNEGYLTISVRQFICYVVRLNTDDNSSVLTAPIGYSGTQGTIGRGQTVDFKAPFPAFVFTGAVKDAEIMFIVRYNQRFWPVELEKRILYKIDRGEDGNLEWRRPYIPAELRELKFAKDGTVARGQR